MLLRDKVIPKHMISGAQQRLGQRDIVGSRVFRVIFLLRAAI